jgi:hypothetical protein
MCQTHTRFEIEKQQQEIGEISLKKCCRKCESLTEDKDFELYGVCRITGKVYALDHICTLEPKTGG